MNKSKDGDPEKLRPREGRKPSPVTDVGSSEQKLKTSSRPIAAEGDTVTKKAGPSVGNPGDEKLKAKRKRKSPDKPWKKPPGMPKRPLSAYNLFYQAERERILGQVVESSGESGKRPRKGVPLSEETAPVDKEQDDEDLDESKKGGRRKGGGKKSGVGFGGLTKNISAKWNLLSQEEKEPYNEKAAIDKKRYDDAIAIWRQVQKEEKMLEAATPKGAGTATSAAAAGATSAASDPSSAESDPLMGAAVASFADECFDEHHLGNDPSTTMNAPSAPSYPAEWFETGTESERGRRNSAGDVFENMERGVASDYAYLSEQVAAKRARQMQRQQRSSYPMSRGDLLHQAPYQTTSASQSMSHHDMAAARADSLHDVGGGRAYSAQQGHTPLDGSRRSLHERDVQYQMYLQQQGGLVQHPDEMRYHHDQIMMMEDQMQLHRELQQTSMREPPRETHQPSPSTGRIARASPNDPMSYFLPPYSQSRERRPLRQPPHSSNLTPRGNTPPPPTHRQLNDSDIAFSPLTPVFGLSLEQQLAETRNDPPFLLSAVDSQLPHQDDPRADGSAIETEYGSHSRMRGVEMPSVLPETSTGRHSATRSQSIDRFTNLLQPRRTAHSLFPMEYHHTSSAGQGPPFRSSPPIPGMGSYATEGYAISERGASIRRPTHRSASLSVLHTPLNTFDQVQREEEHRRYSVSGPTRNRYAFEPNLPAQPPTRTVSESASRRVEPSYLPASAEARTPPSRGRGGTVDDFWPVAQGNNDGDIVSASNNPAEGMSPDTMLTTSIQTLTEKLDDEAIDFLTSMNKQAKK